MPVEARAECFAAMRLEWVISLDARSRASARAEKGVVPVCDASFRVSGYELSIIRLWRSEAYLVPRRR